MRQQYTDIWVGNITIDLYAVIARWLMAYGSGKVPPGASLDDVVRALRVSMREGDPLEHQRLLDAANATTRYVGDQVVAQLEAASRRHHDA
jgi:hypothetical protein